MKKTIFFVLLFCLLFFMSCSVVKHDVTFSKDVITKDYSSFVSDKTKSFEISKIDIKDGFVDLEIKKSDNEYLKITTHEDFFDRLSVNEFAGKTTISGKKNERYVIESIKVELGIKDLTTLDLEQTKSIIDGEIFKENIKVELSAKSDIELSNVNCSEFKLYTSGTSVIKLRNLTTNNFLSDLSGNSVINAETINVLETAKFKFSGTSFLESKNFIAKKVDLDTSGVTRFIIKDFESQDIKSSLSGTSTLEIDLIKVINKFEIDSSGTLILEAKGNVKLLDANLSGYANISEYDLIVSEFILDASGSCFINTTINDKLSVTISGFSSLNYKGKPTVSKLDISGGASVNNIE